jgi:multidrug efflux pump subunit AcrA (membrane-fusion protein)
MESKSTPTDDYKKIIYECFSLFAMSACRWPVASPVQVTVPVETRTVQLMDVPIYGEWDGVLDGHVNAQIQPEGSGYLIRQGYTEDSGVNKGQVLFEINPRPFEAQLAQTRSAFAQAQAQLKLSMSIVTSHLLQHVPSLKVNRTTS